MNELYSRKASTDLMPTHRLSCVSSAGSGAGAGAGVVEPPAPHMSSTRTMSDCLMMAIGLWFVGLAEETHFRIR